MIYLIVLKVNVNYLLMTLLCFLWLMSRAFNESFHQRLEFIQYNAAIAITGTIRGISSEKLFQELRLETLKSRRWFRKLYLFYKNCIYFIKYFILNHLVTSSNEYQKTITHMLHEVLLTIKFLVSM